MTIGSQLRCGGRVLDLERVAIMGVLNVTPDSFSDGGLWLDPAQAVEHGKRMAGDGAAIIDVGGESTRPGATPVEDEEELRRVIPVIEALSSLPDVFIAIDTRKPFVAQRAVEAGASLINDTTGEEADPAMDDVVARSGAGVCVMHSRGTPSTMRTLANYSDVVRNVRGFLTDRAQVLEANGVSPDSICLDPGFGFAKSAMQNLEMLQRLEEFSSMDQPILVGTSRKSFIGEVLQVEVHDRIEGTASTVAVAVMKGARIIRVHDVLKMTRVVRMTEAILNA